MFKKVYIKAINRGAVNCALDSSDDLLVSRITFDTDFLLSDAIYISSNSGQCFFFFWHHINNTTTLLNYTVISVIEGS